VVSPGGDEPEARDEDAVDQRVGAEEQTQNGQRDAWSDEGKDTEDDGTPGGLLLLGPPVTSVQSNQRGAAKRLAAELIDEDVLRQEGGHEHVWHVDQLADLELNGDAANGAALLSSPATLFQVVDHVEQAVARRMRNVYP
jgi:hypothetical protein